jgi:hypothetical protein
MSNNKLPWTIEAILRQLGGHKIFAMAFKTSTYDEDPPTLTLHIANGLRRSVGATHVIVKLDPSDTYTVQVVMWRNGANPGATVVKEMSDVYAENLRSTVESLTGLRLSMGTLSQAQTARRAS